MSGPREIDEAPFMVFWEMTQACDLVCTHCRACAVPERAPDELSLVEGKRLLREVADMGARVVVLTGGDPAKRPDLVELVAYASGLGLRAALTVSATPLVTDALLAELKQADLARIALSLDGATHARHDAFRGVNGSYKRTFAILEAARAAGLTTQINTSLTRFNLHQIEAIAELIRPLGIELWSLFFVVPTGRASDMDALDPELVEDALLRLDVIAQNAPFDVKTTAAPHFRRVQLQRKTPHEDIKGMVDGIGRVRRGINDGSGIMFISHRGDIYPSGFLPIACGNVRTDALASVYRCDPTFRSLRDATLLQGKCGLCPFRAVCGGSRARAFAHTGNLFAEDPACAYIPPPVARNTRWTAACESEAVAGAGVGRRFGQG